jgi:putative toxin-antitoxin system antitoxin component (TIGR02293 family)
MSRLQAASSTVSGSAEEPWRSIFGADPSGGRLQFDEQPGAVRISAPLAYSLLKRGISSRAIGPVGEFLGVGKAEVADMLDIDRGTVARWAARDQPLPTYAAEGLLRLLELDQLAVDTFETEDEARHWLRRPHPLLDGDDPLSAAKTSYGAQRVKDILTAVKYGGVA